MAERVLSRARLLGLPREPVTISPGVVDELRAVILSELLALLWDELPPLP